MLGAVAFVLSQTPSPSPPQKSDFFINEIVGLAAPTLEECVKGLGSEAACADLKLQMIVIEFAMPKNWYREGWVNFGQNVHQVSCNEAEQKEWAAKSSVDDAPEFPTCSLPYVVEIYNGAGMVDRGKEYVSTLNTGPQTSTTQTISYGDGVRNRIPTRDGSLVDTWGADGVFFRYSRYIDVYSCGDCKYTGMGPAKVASDYRNYGVMDTDGNGVPDFLEPDSFACLAAHGVASNDPDMTVGDGVCHWTGTSEDSGYLYCPACRTFHWGIALSEIVQVDEGKFVTRPIEFFSYGGPPITAVDGRAAGFTSTPLEVTKNITYSQFSQKDTHLDPDDCVGCKPCEEVFADQETDPNVDWPDRCQDPDFATSVGNKTCKDAGCVSYDVESCKCTSDGKTTGSDANIGSFQRTGKGCYNTDFKQWTYGRNSLDNLAEHFNTEQDGTRANAGQEFVCSDVSSSATETLVTTFDAQQPITLSDAYTQELVAKVVEVLNGKSGTRSSGDVTREQVTVIVTDGTRHTISVKDLPPNQYLGDVVAMAMNTLAGEFDGQTLTPEWDKATFTVHASETGTDPSESPPSPPAQPVEWCCIAPPLCGSSTSLPGSLVPGGCHGFTSKASCEQVASSRASFRRRPPPWPPPLPRSRPTPRVRPTTF